MKRRYNVGLRPYRFKDNPLEQKFSDEWEKRNGREGRLLGCLLSEGHNRPVVPPTRDRLVSATIIQWLGSPVGQAFIREVMEGKMTSKSLSDMDQHELIHSAVQDIENAISALSLFLSRADADRRPSGPGPKPNLIHAALGVREDLRLIERGKEYDDLQKVAVRVDE